MNIQEQFLLMVLGGSDFYINPTVDHMGLTAKFSMSTFAGNSLVCLNSGTGM